tara:strand:- start:42843 stop:43532 length:690 start_codon:yes stop_codon:yes gene_type:complete
VKIYYTTTIPHGQDETFQHPTFPDDYEFNPEPYINTHDRTHDHMLCPAFKEWSKNRWTFYSPIDIHFRVDSGNKMIGSDTCAQSQFERLFRIRDGWWENELPEIEIQYLHLFWTKAKHVWVEFTGHESNKGFNMVPGTFPISSWVRALPLGLVVTDIDKDINIKRGDPICNIRFYDKKGSKFQLDRSIPDNNIVKRVKHDRELKDWSPFKSWDLIMKREEKQCPLRFLS